MHRGLFFSRRRELKCKRNSKRNGSSPPSEGRVTDCDWKIPHFTRISTRPRPRLSRCVWVFKPYHLLLWQMRRIKGPAAAVAKCQLRDLHTFACPSLQISLRGVLTWLLRLRAHAAPHSVAQNWVIDLPHSFIFRFEWHSWEFFQLSWSQLCLVLSPQLVDVKRRTPKKKN